MVAQNLIGFSPFEIKANPEFETVLFIHRTKLKISEFYKI